MSFLKFFSMGLGDRLRESGMGGARERLAGRLADLSALCRHLNGRYSANIGDRGLAAGMEADFSLALDIWRISPSEALRAASVFRREAGAWAVIAVWASAYLAWAAWSGHAGISFWTIALAVLPSCAGLAAARLWRAECLERERFVPFRRWLARGWAGV